MKRVASLSFVLGFFGLVLSLAFLSLPAYSQVNPQTKSENFELTIPSPSIKVTGKAAPGSLVTIKEGSSVVASVTANSNGYFSKSYTTTAGIHEITTYYDDPISNRSVVNKKSISVQPQLQSVHDVFLSPTIYRASSEVVTQGSLIQVRGYTYAGAKVTLSVDYGAKNYTTTAKSNGFYELLINSDDLSLGSHQASVFSEFGGSKSQNSKQIEFNIEPKPDYPNPSAPDLIVASSQLPPPTPVTPNDGAVIDGDSVTLTGESVPFAQINIYENGKLWGSVFADENGRWSFDYKATFTPVTFSFEACVDGECSVLSKTITLNFNGVNKACRPSISLKKYRFWGLAVNQEFEIEVESASSESGVIEIIWDDGRVERFDYDPNKNSKFSKSYTKTGTYNAKLRFFESRQIDDNSCYAERFFSVNVSDDKDSSALELFLSLLAILLIYIVFRKFFDKKPAVNK